MAVIANSRGWLGSSVSLKMIWGDFALEHFLSPSDHCLDDFWLTRRDQQSRISKTIVTPTECLYKQMSQITTPRRRRNLPPTVQSTKAYRWYKTRSDCHISPKYFTDSAGCSSETSWVGDGVSEFNIPERISLPSIYSNSSWAHTTFCVHSALHRKAPQFMCELLLILLFPFQSSFIFPRTVRGWIPFKRWAPGLVWKMLCCPRKASQQVTSLYSSTLTQYKHHLCKVPFGGHQCM